MRSTVEKNPDFIVFRINGDRMSDGSVKSLNDGDLLLCRYVQMGEVFKMPVGKTFVVHCRHKGILVVQINRYDIAKDVITCHFHNPEFKDLQVNISEIEHVYHVVKVIKVIP